MLLLKHGVRLGLTMLAILGGSLAVAGPANAAATPAEVCGNNYHEIDKHDIPGARIHLLYNGSTNCVVTTKNHPGDKTTMLAAIAKNDNGLYNFIDDRGEYTNYAGPVKVSAKGVCIDWGGASDPGWNVWYKGPSHCG